MTDKGRVMMIPERDVRRMTKTDFRIAMLESRVAQLEHALAELTFCVHGEIYEVDLLERRDKIEELGKLYPCKDS